MTDFDAVVADRVLPQYRPIVTAFRDLMREVAPEAQEIVTGGTPKYPGNPAWRCKRIIVLISPTKKGVTIAFSRGAEFDDPYGVLEGVGKTSKNVRYHDVADFDAEKMAYYVRQAVALDE
jgi:hypothetical protein